jgi:hypothetical protein
MEKLLRWLATLLLLFWTSLRDLPSTGWALYRAFLDRLRRWWRRQQLSERDRRKARHRCVPIAEPAYHRPDPTIYSQAYLTQLGLAVTWDNPDIQLYRGGAPVSSAHLDPDTEYQIVARVWNNSTEAPVVNLPVRFSYLSFGIGTESHPIADSHIDLGVKGGVDQPAFAQVTWRTPGIPGHYCIQARLDWLDDANPENNLGQENTDVIQLQSPAESTFALRNGTGEALRYRFVVDTYQIPPRPPCDGTSPPKRPGPPAMATRQVAAEHDRRNYPLPDGWDVVLDPPEPELAAGTEQAVRATVTAPGGFTGRLAINIHAFGRYGLVGGVTLYVEGT